MEKGLKEKEEEEGGEIFPFKPCHMVLLNR